MSRFLAALGIGAVASLATAIVALLVATVWLGTDRAVFGALPVALAGGVVSAVVSWWMLGARPRALRDDKRRSSSQH